MHVLQRKSYFGEGALSLLRLPKELPRRHGSNAGAPSASRELPQRRRSSFVQKVGNEGAPSTNVIFSEIIVSCDSFVEGAPSLPTLWTKELLRRQGSSFGVLSPPRELLRPKHVEGTPSLHRGNSFVAPRELFRPKSSQRGSSLAEIALAS